MEAANQSRSIREAPAFQRADLLRKAWELPVARRYDPLLYQSLTSICGPTTVANVLRSMGVEARKNPLRGLGFRAMSLEQVAREAAELVSPDWTVRMLRPETVEAFRAELRFFNDERRRYAANFARGPLFGRGGGHHSPIGGYLEAEDLVLVLDVNASFGPWLVRPDRLFEAVHTLADRWAVKWRGLVCFEKAEPSSR